jgi:hypothetical protein
MKNKQFACRGSLVNRYIEYAKSGLGDADWQTIIDSRARARRNIPPFAKATRKRRRFLLTLTQAFCTKGKDLMGVDVAEKGLRGLQLAISNDVDWR